MEFSNDPIYRQFLEVAAHILADPERPKRLAAIKARDREKRTGQATGDVPADSPAPTSGAGAQ